MAIDFTLSNRIKGLHSKSNSESKTAYESVISSLGKTLYQIDDDKELVCWGFGGSRTNFPESDPRIPFNLSGLKETDSTSDPDVILKWYADSVAKTKFGSPTDFAPIIKKFREAHVQGVPTAETSRQKKLYSILLIITDGVVQDEELQNTIREIGECCKHRVSIIIVGVGDDKFENMNKLDGDDGEEEAALRSLGVTRDIVQFVDFKKVKHNVNLLISEIIEELPKHIEEALGNNNIK